MIDKRLIESWLCEDCTFVFQTFGIKMRGRRRAYYCPNCGDNVAVIEYVADRFNKNKIHQPWKDEELKILEHVINGEILKYQAAIILGRSIKSVRRKIERLNEERSKVLGKPPRGDLTKL